MPNDSKVLVPYNVLNTPSLDATPLLYAGSGLTSIETNRAAAERATHESPQTPRWPIGNESEPSAPIEELNVPQVLEKRRSTSADPLEAVWQAWQDKYEQAKTFIEQGYNEQEIDIQRDLITELKQAKEAITNIPAELSSPVDAMISDANSKSKGWIDELAESDRANAYQLARHIDGSLKVVTEALKAFKHDQDLELETWKEKISAGYKQKHGLTQDTDNLRHHITLRRHAVRERLKDVRHELESSKNKIQRKGWRNTFKREAEVKAYFEQVMNALEVVINEFKGKKKQFEPSFKDSAASMFISQAGQSKEEKRQRGEHAQDKASKGIDLAELEVAMGEQILKFEDAAIKVGKGAKNKMAKVVMQVARTPTYVAPTAMHLLHKARSPMAKGVNKALNHNLSDEEQIIRSIVRSLCWALIQPAFRMQYDYAPLLGAAQSLAKSKHSTTDSVDVLETMTEGSTATSGINKAASSQSEQGAGEAEKSRQDVLEPSLKKAQQVSESLLAQVSLGGNGALRDVLNHYQPSDLNKLSEQLQGLSLSEDTPDKEVRPSLGKDVQILKTLLAQEPSDRGAQLNQVSASERERFVNILATIKDMGLSEQRFNKTVKYFLGVGQEVLSEDGQESLGNIVVKIEDALRKGEAYKKVRAMALRLRARATKASDYKDSSLDSIIHKARFAGLAARDAYDELDSLALKHTGQPLGPFSRRSRVAKDWGMCANEVLREAGHRDAAIIPDTEVIRHALTERDMLTGLVSEKDPLGIFFSTRITGEWRYAYRDKTIKPMSPAEYAAQEKTLAEFIVGWSQKRLARGVVVSFIEGGMDVVGGLTVTPIKIGVRAGIKVPISLIRIGYDVHKIKQGVMPGEDKPYKVIKARITHRLEQLGFKMVMIPVGSTVKTVFAAGVSAAAHAHNAMVEKEEDKVKISSWAKVLGTEASLTGVSVPVTLGAKTAVNLVMEPSPKLTTDEQQVVEQIKQALAGESASEELDAVDESNPISNAYPDIDRGEGEYKEAVDVSLAKIANTPFGRDLIESMNEQRIEITQPSEDERLRQEEGQTFYATYANPEQNTIFFDPWNTLAAESDEHANDKPWLRRDPSIALFHEMLHLYYHSHPVKVNYQDDWLTIDELGAKLAPDGASEQEKESLSHGIFEHFVAGADYDANDVHLAFSDPSFIEQSVQVGNGRYISENDYREAFYRAQGQAVIKRLDYGDSSFTGHDGDRYAPSSQSGEDQEEDWQYKVSETHTIEIKGTQEYFEYVSDVFDELSETKEGERLLAALQGKDFSISLPESELYHGMTIYPASTDLDKNIIYFDPLSLSSFDSDSAGIQQPMLKLAHELIHILDKDNLIKDGSTFTKEDKGRLEHMAVGIPYVQDGQRYDFSKTEVKKAHLKEGAPIFTVNQLRKELGIKPRTHYTMGDSDEGRLNFQYPDNSNLKTEVGLFKRYRELQGGIEWCEREKEATPGIQFLKRNWLDKKKVELEAELDQVDKKMALFKGEVPNIERLAYAKLWLAEAEAGSFEENIAKQYLEHVNWNIEQGWNEELDQEYSRDSDSRVLTVDEFKREIIQELRAAYFTGDRVKAYALILSKLESVNEKLDNRDWEDEEKLQALLEQQNILTNADAIFINQATSPGIPEVRYLFLPGNVEDIEAAARSYYENMDRLALPDGTVVSPEEQRALIDIYGGPEEFAEHMRMAHEHNKVLSMSETLTPDQFLLMIAERTLEENGRLPPEGEDIDASFLDKKVMVRFDHVKRTWTSGDDFEQDEWSTEKEFTVKEILLGKHKQYAKSQSPAAGNGYCSVASMTSSDQEVAGLERELGNVRVQNEYMDHVDDLKGNSQFMGALQHRLKTQLYQRLTDLGADKGQLVTVGIDHQPDSLVGHSGRLNMNSVFAIRNDDGTFTFFSLLTDKTFTTTNADEESSWENEKKGEIEAQGWLKDPNSEFNKFMSAHIDPKERFSASDYELKLDFFDRGSVLNQRLEDLGVTKGDLVSVGINYQPDSHTINRGPLDMDSVFAVKNDDGTLTFFSLYSEETFTTTKVDDENSLRNEQDGMREAYRWLRDPNSEFHNFMAAHILPEESSYKLQLDLFDHQSEELNQRREELGLNQGDLVSVGINNQQDGHFGHSRRLNMDSVYAVRNDDGTLTFFSQSSDEKYTTTKVDDEHSWRNEQEGMKEAYYWLRDPNSEFYRFMSAHIEPEDRLSSLGHDLSGYDLRLNLVDHQNEDALLGKNTENFMDFMKNWMDVNSRSEGEEVIEAFSFWVNELGKAWTAATDSLPLPIKFMARMGFTIVQGSLNMANAETIAERDEAGRNMGYSMGKVAAFSAASGTANPKAMKNFKAFPGPTPADKVFTAREHTANVIGRGPVSMGTKWGGAPSADDRIRSTFQDPDKGYTPASQPTAATKPNEVLDFGTTDEIWGRMMNGESQSFETVPESPPTTSESLLQDTSNQSNPAGETMEAPITSMPPPPSSGRGSMESPIAGRIGDYIERGQICTRRHSEDDRIYYLAAKFTGPIRYRPDPEDEELWHKVKSERWM